MSISKTSNQIQIKIKMPNTSQEPWASSKDPSQDLEDMDVLCTFKVKIVSQKLEHGYSKDQWPYPKQDERPVFSQEPPVSSKAQIQKLKDMDLLCNYKIKIESQHSKPGISKTSVHIQFKIKTKPSQEPPASSNAPTSGLRGYGCSLHLQNQDREPKLKTRVYQRPVTISKSRSRC